MVRKDTKTTSSIALTLGIWLIVSPFYFEGIIGNLQAMSNNVFIGALLFTLAVFKITGAKIPALKNIYKSSGGWLLVSPIMFGLSHEPLAMWNDLIVGTAVFTAATGGFSAFAGLGKKLQAKIAGYALSRFTFNIWILTRPAFIAKNQNKLIKRNPFRNFSTPHFR